MAALSALRGRGVLAAAAAGLAVAVASSGCAAGEEFSLPEWDAPGQNARVGEVMVRYAHVAEPRGDEPWQPGDDVPAYVWLYNKGGAADELVAARTPNAASVDIVGSGGRPAPGGVELPEEKLVELERGKRHLVLRDVSEVIRAGDSMEFTLRFEKAGAVTFNVRSQVPVREDGS